MALCNYEIHVKGNKQEVLMFFATIKDLGRPKIINEFEISEEYILWFKGQCADERDLYGYETTVTVIDHNLLTEEGIRDGKCAEEFFNLSLRQKSELLGVEILIRSWSKESDYDQIEHYRNGFFVSAIGGTYQEDDDLEFNF